MPRGQHPFALGVFALKTQADARIRTADPYITSEVLYQLSYVGATGQVSAPTRWILAWTPRRPVAGT